MFSIIIPTLHAPLLHEAVAAAARQTARHLVREIIVVGQEPSGRVPAPARFVETSRPLAAGAARNLGARMAAGETLLFLDADCIAAPDLVERHAARHAAGHTVVGGGVVVEPAGYWTDCDNLLIFAPFLDSAPSGPRPFLPSLNLSLRRALFDALGGFDERFAGAAGEDTELCLRLRAAGHQLFFAPEARVTHRPQRTSAGAVFSHLRAYGRAHYRVQRQHPRLMPSPLGRLSPALAGAVLAAAPLLALVDALRLLRAHPVLRRRPSALGGMAWAKLGWYWGAAEALMAHRSPPR
ncbi:MAG TPA: glycosyltransferase [Roseiflexaceae bacterium]|nr:glycosyltransferase [Roseiflexaceae bacterium]